MREKIAMLIMIGLVAMLVSTYLKTNKTVASLDSRTAQLEELSKRAEENKKRSADRFAGSEAVFLLNKIEENGVCINYTQEEVAKIYEGKKPAERKVLQSLLNNKWQCK